MTYSRGGFPVVHDLVVTSAGLINGGPAEQVKYPLRGETIWLGIQTLDNPVKVYFTLADFNASKRGLLVTESWGGPALARNLWFRATGSDATIQVVALMKG